MSDVFETKVIDIDEIHFRKMEDKSCSVKSVEKAFRILDCFLGREKKLSLKELSEKTGLPKSTVYNLLSTMRKQRIIIQHESDGKYSLGMHIFQLGKSVDPITEFVDIARPFMDKLAEDSNRSVHLTTLYYPSVLLISRVESLRNKLKLIVPVGTRMPAYCTAHGKIFLSYMSKNAINNYLSETELAPYTSRTITDPKIFKKQIEEVRKQKYAIEKDERNLGITGIAAPIEDSNGQILYSVGIVGLFNDIPDPEFQKLVDKVVATAKIITEKIRG